MNDHHKAAERFAKDTAQHQMTVLHDQGVYRHLRFKRPGCSAYYFDLITYPGGLLYRGDMGDFVFERLQDMFEFFRSDKGRINPGYWSEKVTTKANITEHDSEQFTRCVKEWVLGWMRDHREETTKDDRRDLWDEVHADVLECAEDPQRGFDAANNFHWQAPGSDGVKFYFQDFWEHNFDRYTLRFLWCCYALVWAIGVYDKSKTVQAAA